MFLQVLDDDLDSLAAVSVYQESDNNNESLWCQYNLNDKAMASVPFFRKNHAGNQYKYQHNA